jgi:YggT family protein
MNIYNLIDTLFYVYWIILLVYILSSWVPPLRASSLGELLGKLSEPYLTPFRKIIPPIGGMLDLSPIVALFALQFIKLGVFFVIDLFV